MNRESSRLFLVIAVTTVVAMLAVSWYAMAAVAAPSTLTGDQSRVGGAYGSDSGSPTGCTEGLGAPSSSSMIDVLEISPGSEGLVCLNFGFMSLGNYTFNADYSCAAATPKNESGSSPTTNEQGSSSTTIIVRTLPRDCFGLNITSSSGPISTQPGKNITVVFTIKTLDNDSELYWVSFGPCGFQQFLVAVGTTPSNIPISYLWPQPICPILTPGDPASVTATGTYNFTVVAVPLILGS